MNGDALSTLIDELNGGATIGDTLKFQLVNAYKAMLEQERPWAVLRKTDTSKSVTVANTWQTAIDLSTITGFSRFIGSRPVRLFDGSQRIVRYRQVPFGDRLEHISAPQTFVFDQSTKALYLNGTVQFAGSLYIRHLAYSANLTENSLDTAWPFPSWAYPFLAFGAVAMHKGGVDYDEVNARQLIQNNADAVKLYRALAKWDNEQQLSELDEYDQSAVDDDQWRPGAININA
jgi:hypothetical protein